MAERAQRAFRVDSKASLRAVEVMAGLPAWQGRSHGDTRNSLALGAGSAQTMQHKSDRLAVARDRDVSFWRLGGLARLRRDRARRTGLRLRVFDVHLCGIEPTSKPLFDEE